MSGPDYALRCTKFGFWLVITGYTHYFQLCNILTYHLVLLYSSMNTKEIFLIWGYAAESQPLNYNSFSVSCVYLLSILAWASGSQLWLPFRTTKKVFKNYLLLDHSSEILIHLLWSEDQASSFLKALMKSQGREHWSKQSYNLFINLTYSEIVGWSLK